MKKIVIEVLYPEYKNLYGDRGNCDYLNKKLTLAGYDVEIIETSLFDEPAFVTSKVDLLLIGPCQEKHQLNEIEQLKKYADSSDNSLYSKKDLYAIYRKRFIRENKLDILDITDERYSGSIRY